MDLLMESVKRYIDSFNIYGYINAKGEHITIMQYDGLGKGHENAKEYFIESLIYHIFSNNFKGFLKSGGKNIE